MTSSPPPRSAISISMPTPYNGGDLAGLLVLRDARVKRMQGVWMRAFGQRGNQDATDAFTGYEYKLAGSTLGYDHIFGDYTLGMSLGMVNNRVTADGDTSRGHVDSTLYSIYGGYRDNGNYINGVVSFGRN